MKMNLNGIVSKTHFHMKGFALGLVLKQRQKATRKWLFFLRNFEIREISVAKIACNNAVPLSSSFLIFRTDVVDPLRSFTNKNSTTQLIF